MIDIITGSERNLRDIRQIGTPSDEDKIYIENAAYGRVHDEDYADKRIFIFMGHTECTESKYTTFIEAAIPVHDLDFSQNIPQWNNHAWSDVFREIKRSYEDSIIVGWAMDLKGFPPRMTPELEAVHREQFGGAHQVFFYMDSIEGEEYFYINRGNCLQKKDGFYIYFCPKLQKMRADVTLEVPQESRVKLVSDGIKGEKREDEQPDKTFAGKNVTSIAHYRESMKQKGEKTRERKASSYAMMAAIVLLLAMVGAGVYQDRIRLSGLEAVINTMGIGAEEKTDDADVEVLVGTELVEQTGDTEGTEVSASETLNLIPVTELSSGEIKTIGEEKTEEESSEEGEENDASDEVDDGEEDNAADETAADANQYYTVQAGDTLTAICNKTYGSTDKMAEVVEANHLENSDDIRVGQKLLLP